MIQCRCANESPWFLAIPVSVGLISLQCRVCGFTKLCTPQEAEPTLAAQAKAKKAEAIAVTETETEHEE